MMRQMPIHHNPGETPVLITQTVRRYVTPILTFILDCVTYLGVPLDSCQTSLANTSGFLGRIRRCQRHGSGWRGLESGRGTSRDKIIDWTAIILHTAYIGNRYRGNTTESWDWYQWRCKSWGARFEETKFSTAYATASLCGFLRQCQPGG